MPRSSRPSPFGFKAIHKDGTKKGAINGTDIDTDIGTDRNKGTAVENRSSTDGTTETGTQSGSGSHSGSTKVTGSDGGSGSHSGPTTVTVSDGGSGSHSGSTKVTGSDGGSGREIDIEVLARQLREKRKRKKKIPYEQRFKKKNVAIEMELVKLIDAESAGEYGEVKRIFNTALRMYYGLPLKDKY